MPRTIAIPTAPPKPLPLSNRDALSWLFLYRLLLAALLVLAFSFPQATPWLTSGGDPATARLLLTGQAVLVLMSGLLLITGWPSREQQVQIAVFLDIVVYTLLMHFSGGVATGLGLLPAIAVASGALLLEGRLSLLFASLATLGVITQQIYSQLYVGTQSGTYTQAGLLGLTYFTVAMLAHVLASRLRESERIAARRKVDIADLSKLNEYVIQGLATGVVVVDGERNLLMLNNAARRLLAVPDPSPGAPLIELAPLLRRWLEQELTGRSPPEPVLELAGGEVRPSLILLGDQRANGALIYLRDNQDLARQAQEMKLASLGRLTASIAHNIRNPLSSVNHATQLLAESRTLADDDRHLLDIMRRNVRRIDETVTSVLELSRRQQAEPSPVDLRLWLEEFCDEYRDSNTLPAEALRLTLPPAETSVTVRIDPRHLGQIIRNLCDNGFKHGGADGRSVQVELTLARDTSSGECTLELADNGPGVPVENQRTIFEPFFTTSSSGTGLGLYAARELAQANGVRLEYVAGAGKARGACFRLTFTD
jgi:two-component system sensor histidine kinase PilS (NtrC family)